MRDLVGAGGSEATWRELSGLTTAARVQVRRRYVCLANVGCVTKVSPARQDIYTLGGFFSPFTGVGNGYHRGGGG